MKSKLPGLKTTTDDETSNPKYELRIYNHGTNDLEIEVFQLPSIATPALKSPRRLAGLRGRNLALMEHRVLRHLSQEGISLQGILPGMDHRTPIKELPALQLALLFRALAPMRNRDNMKQVADGIEEMSAEEASYWLGMAMYRNNPRRVLMALRFLIIDPKLSSKEVIRG